MILSRSLVICELTSYICLFFLMIRRPPRSTRTDTLFPYTTLFRSVANRPVDAPIGLIPVDSLYSPVRQVSYKVENARVGQELDYDKLSLTVETDGTVAPEDALAYAARILQDQLTLRSEEHTSELQSLMRISYAVFCLKKTKYLLTTL